jgi:amidohydrolase
MNKHAPTAVLVLLACALGLPGRTVKAPDLDKRVSAMVQDITPGLIALRRDIHAHPELSGREFRTSALVAEAFRKLGLEVRTGIAGTGVLGVLRGGKPGPVVGIRADMDALPLTEETGLDFASHEHGEVDGRPCGVMHACGHDIHTALLVGEAEILARLRADLRGTILFVAQPAEEDGDGARQMLADGVFHDLRPEAMFAFHVHDQVRAGMITYIPGFAAANCDGFRLTIKSEGCHGSAPALCVDPIVVGAQVVLALQVMVSREIDVQDKTVVTVGAFHAGSASNIIPDRAVLQATVRSYGEDQRRVLRRKIERLIEGQCRAAGADSELDYQFGTASLYNDPALLRHIRPTVERVLGGGEFLKEDPPEMGGEDFSYFSREVPSVMLYLGVLPADLDRTSLHSPTFRADEAAIPLGVKVMTSVVIDYLFDPLRRE